VEIDGARAAAAELKEMANELKGLVAAFRY
jgi:methyl-accepting chemotaxis protein